MLLATALALLITGCAQQTFTVQTNRAAVAPKGNHHPSFLRFWNWAEEKLSMQPKFVAAQKMLLNRNPANIVNGLLGFITFSIYTRWKRVWLSLYELPIDMGKSHLHCSLIYFCPFQLFLHSDQLSEGEIIPFSGVCQSGRLYYPRRRRWWLHALTGRLL